MTNSRELNNHKQIPKDFHFIWLGGTLPHDYLTTILELLPVAKASGFNIHLWVDDIDNFNHALEPIKSVSGIDLINSYDITIARDVQVHNINELKAGMLESGFYTNNDLQNYKDYWRFIQSECVGLKNFAAASDLIRYELLRQKGGYYFDTDTIFLEINKPRAPLLKMPNIFYESKDDVEQKQLIEKYYPHYLKHYSNYLTHVKMYNEANPDKAVLPSKPIPLVPANRKKYNMNKTINKLNNHFNIENNYQSTNAHFDSLKTKSIKSKSEAIRFNPDQPEYGVITDSDVSDYNNTLLGSNDMIGVVPDHDACLNAIKIAIDRYKEWEKEMETSSRTWLDTKRVQQDNPDLHGRRRGTVFLSGPDAWLTAVENFIYNLTKSKKEHLSHKMFKSIAKKISINNGKRNRATMADAEVLGKSDQTWLQQDNQNIKAYESIFPKTEKHTINLFAKIEDQLPKKESCLPVFHSKPVKKG